MSCRVRDSFDSEVLAYCTPPVDRTPEVESMLDLKEGDASGDEPVQHA